MKKTTFIPLILLIIASCGSPVTNDNNRSATENESTATAADSVTLNGYTFAEATSMVKEFRKDSVSSNARTSIWFSKEYIDSLSTILGRDTTLDGFRIYFAKKNGKNDIVMVATKQTTIVNPYDPSKFVHQDYFELESAYFKTAGRVERGDVKHDAPLSGISVASAADCNETPCNKSPSGISCIQGKKWVKQFRKAPINVRNLWYPIELIHYWKAELDAAVRKNKKGDGIRIYFAKKDTGKNAFVIVATRDNGQKKSDYYECYSDDKTNFIGVDDNGEECPINCHGATWE